LVGRWERGSADVGIDSGMGSDIVVVSPQVWIWRLRDAMRWLDKVAGAVIHI
jgi:hypothetical protein